MQTSKGARRLHWFPVFLNGSVKQRSSLVGALCGEGPRDAQPLRRTHQPAKTSAVPEAGHANLFRANDSLGNPDCCGILFKNLMHKQGHKSKEIYVQPLGQKRVTGWVPNARDVPRARSAAAAPAPVASLPVPIWEHVHVQ